MTTTITTTGRDSSIRPMTETECDKDIGSNTIPMKQLSVIISQRSHNGWNASPVMTMIITSTGIYPINDRNGIPFLLVNWARSSVREPTVKGAILPLDQQYREPMAFLIVPTIQLRLKFTRMPTILTMKIKTKTKSKTMMIQPSQILRKLAAVTTSCQRSPRTTKMRCSSRIGCYIHSYSNNKLNGRTRAPECFPNSTAAKPPTDRRIPEINSKSVRWLTP